MIIIIVQPNNTHNNIHNDDNNNDNDNEHNNKHTTINDIDSINNNSC